MMDYSPMCSFAAFQRKTFLKKKSCLTNRYFANLKSLYHTQSKLVGKELKLKSLAFGLKNCTRHQGEGLPTHRLALMNKTYPSHF